MGRFDAPNPVNELTKNTEWYEAAPPGMRSPDHLWKEYWQRFNTYPISIFDSNKYFETAMEIAKASKNKADFERKFEKHNKQQYEVLNSALKDLYWVIEETYPALDAQNPTSTAQNPTSAAPRAIPPAQKLRCLDHFVQLLHTYVYQRKSDKKPKTIVVEKQDHTKENSRQERGHELMEDETEELIREIIPAPSADPEYEKSLDEEFSSEDEWGTQLPEDIDYGYRLDQEYKMRYGGSNTFARAEFESSMLLSDDAASHTLNSEDDTPSIQQVPSLISNDSQDLKEGNESLATQDELRRRSSISSKSQGSNSAKKRVRFDDDEDISIHEPKRRKVDNSLAHTETSPTPQATRASSIQAAHGSASRKRSRSDEDEEDNGYKRQKIESLPRPPSPVPNASFTEDDSANHLAQGSSEKVLEEQVPESDNSGRKRRKQKPKSPTSRANSSRNTLNTRSSRRSNSSTLWELDASGKPRSNY